MTTVSRVAVVGAGYMGGGIAQSLAAEGIDVAIADVDAAASVRSHARLLAETEDFESRGLFPAGSLERVTQHLRAAPSIEEAVADADFIEEAVFEKLEVKREVLARISAAARPDAVIGTNTSTIPVRELESAVTHPERFLTVHFSNPAPFIPGVELVAGVATSEETIATVKTLLERANREGAQVADTPGFVLNRLQFTLLKEATRIVEEGVATMEDVDTIVRTTFGFRLGFFGPFAIADQAGLDVYNMSFKTFEDAYGERLAKPELIAQAVAEGKHGVKNGRGLTGDFNEADREALVAYRNTAYARLNELLRELGPAPRPQ